MLVISEVPDWGVVYHDSTAVSNFGHYVESCCVVLVSVGCSVWAFSFVGWVVLEERLSMSSDSVRGLGVLMWVSADVVGFDV